MNEPMDPVQSEGLRRTSPAQKRGMLSDLYHVGIALRVAGMRLQHRDLPRDQLEIKARRACAMPVPGAC
jgi:hypothetical protein